MKKRKLGDAILYGFMGFIIYFFIFPIGTGKDLVPAPVKAYDLSLPISHPGNVSLKDGTSWFRAGQMFGFIDAEGRVLFHDTVDFDVALTDAGFINYSSIQESEQGLVYRNAMGDLTASFQMPGYPVLNNDGDRVVLVKTDATGITGVSIDGGAEWSASFASIITALAATDQYALVGLLSGHLKLYDQEGRGIYAISFKSSKSETVYGCAIAKNARELAAVCGVNPQRLVLIRKGGSNYEKPSSRDLSSEFRKPVHMEFSDDGELLFLEGDKTLLVADTDTLEINEVPFSGRFAGLSVGPRMKYSVLLGKSVIGSTTLFDMRMFFIPGRTFMKEVFGARDASVKMFSRYLLVGIDSHLLVMEIREV